MRDDPVLIDREALPAKLRRVFDAQAAGAELEWMRAELERLRKGG